MKVLLFTFWVSVTLFATDEVQLAVAMRAQSDFQRVELSPKPGLAEAENCLQSQAAALAVATPEELPILHFRKGWCALASDVATGHTARSATAMAEFDQARETWPARLRRKNMPPEPLPSGLRAVVAIERLRAGADTRQELADVVERPVCTSNLMSPEFCRQILETGRQW